MNKCETLGHEWQVTAVPGWFRCMRLVGYRTVKSSGRGVSTYCNLLAHCPGCLGYCLIDYPLVLCTLHYACRVEDFPVIASSGSGASNQGATDVHQISLWGE